MTEKCECCGRDKPQEPWVKDYRDNNKYCYICGRIGHLLIGKTDYPTNKPEYNTEFRICMDCIHDDGVRFSNRQSPKMPDTNQS